MSLRKAIFALALPVLSLFVTGTASAQTPAPFVPEPIKTEIAIPIAERVEGYTGDTVADLANYIGVIYQFMISIIGVVAAVMMIIGGFQYLTSAGDAGKIGAARKRITDALIGLVLAFSAYLLLNTINPALLEFKPIGAQLAKNNVETELAFLEWCDDVVEKGLYEPTSNGVVPVLAQRTQGADDWDCGSIGLYVLKKSKDAGFCVYRGDNCLLFEEGGSVRRRVACTRRALTPTEAKGIVDSNAENPNDADFERVRAADCMACSDLNETWAAKVGYTGSISQLCSAWQKDANAGSFDDMTGDNVKRAFGTSVVSYCGYSLSNKSCVQSDIDCSSAYENKDDYGPVTHRDFQPAFTRGDDPDCQGYDEGSNNITWMDINTNKMKYSPDAHLEDYPDHLYNVCVANPCNYNASNGGCSPGGGLIKSVTHALSSGSLTGVQDCNNKGRTNGVADTIF